MKKIILLLFPLCLLACSMPEVKTPSRMTCFFDEPAGRWEASFPLGNGRIGMMPDGGIEHEQVVLNDISMWSGSRQDADNPYAYYSLANIRSLLFQGRNDEAQEWMYKTFICNGAGSGQGKGADLPYGCYQLLGNLQLEYTFPQTDVELQDYRRTLDLEQAVTTTSFKKGTVRYLREAFTSFSDDVGVIHLTSDVDKGLTFTIGQNRPEHYKVRTEGNDLVMEGQLPDGVDTLVQSGLRYESRIRVLLPKGGAIAASDSMVRVHNASEAVILVAMATNYFDSNLSNHILTLLKKAEKKDFNGLKRDHVKAYQSLFGRVKLDLGSSAGEVLPIDERLHAFRSQEDPSLAALYFQFGRYLLISSTREGSLPPNLQGLWCNTVQTPWNGDYHLNINLQMNHWPAEVANLSELHLPLTRWIGQQVESGTKTAKVYYNARGWVTHILGNVWNFTAPGEHPSWGATNTAAAWLCEHLYQHYQFTKDEEYLKEVYPIMKGAATFFVDMLVMDPRSKYLVTAPTTSPENAYKLPNGNTASICAGSTMDNQIIRELFSNTITASRILKTDSAFARLLADKAARLKPTEIGADGRIMEWLEPYEEVERHHRHVSHLFGLYPGNEISLRNTPRLAEAARKSLEARGDEGVGWSMAWKINFWARLHEGERAYRLLKELLRPCLDTEMKYTGGGGTYPNLFCACPPFQIDGNFGGCAGIAEMLIQSQDGIIEFLPAVPEVWKHGSFDGLCVRGGAEVGARWMDNRIQYMSLRATADGHFSIRLADHSENLSLEKNDKPISLPVINGLIEVDLVSGDCLELVY